MALIPGSFVDSRVDLHYLVSLVMLRLISELYQPKEVSQRTGISIALPTDGLAALVLVIRRSSCAEGGGDGLLAPVLSTLFGRPIGSWQYHESST